ncbi:Tyrosine recombinase XerC [compost metagenome]
MRYPIYPQYQESRPEERGLLDSWLAARADADMYVIRDRNTYDHMWSTWCAYLQSGRNGLQSQAIRWFDVTPEILVGFLNNGPVNRKVRTESTRSATTKYRYWRLLERIYNFAMMKGWISSNPVDAMAAGNIPKSEKQQGSVLDPSVWKVAELLLLTPAKYDAVAVRNRAILQLLFALGLAPLEVRGMQLSSLVHEGESGKGRRISAVQIGGPGTLRPRRFPLGAFEAELVTDWLKVRPLIATEASGELLFCTPRGGVSPVSLFLLVQGFLKEASAAAGCPPPIQAGPQIIRNSVLVRLLNDAKYPACRVVKFAGLKDVKGLLHLKDHCNSAALLSIRRAGEGSD